MIDGRIDDDTDPGRRATVLVHRQLHRPASWQFVRPLLAEDHVVVAYDPGGHSRSGPLDGRGTRRVQ